MTLTDDFNRVFADANSIKILNQDAISLSRSTLIFTKEDIAKTNHPIAKLLRIILVDNNVTYEIFKIKHHQYCQSIHIPPSKINSDRNNLSRAMLDSTLTWTKFEQIVCLILGFSILKIPCDNVFKCKY